MKPLTSPIETKTGEFSITVQFHLRNLWFVHFLALSKQATGLFERNHFPTIKRNRLPGDLALTSRSQPVI